jgi:TonB-dependent receptor
MKAIALAFTLVLSLCFISTAWAQSGVIQGTVYDESSEEYLPGANVSIKGTNISTSTDRNGVFRLRNIQQGTYTILVSYIGYESMEKEVEVKTDEITLVDVKLKSSIIDLGSVVVVGQRFGQSRALNQQKTSDRIVNIVAADQIGRFPDPNSAEAIQRLPGISVQRDQGEGRYVVLRGTEPRLSSMTINGDQIPSPEGDVRYAALDVIPADQLSALEVTKAITPEMDGESIGGTVNLITKSAFDYPDKVVKFTLAPGYNDLMQDYNFQSAFTYGDRLTPDEKMGLMISGSYYRTNRGSDNNEMEWDDEEFGGAEKKVINSLELRDYEVIRDRLGLSTTLDYKLNRNSTLYWRGIYNRYGDDEHRRTLNPAFDKGEYVSPNNVSDFAVERELKDRYEVQDVYSAKGGVKHEFSKLALEYSVAYSYAQEEEPDRYDSNFEFEDDVSGAYDISDPELPKWNITSDHDIYDPAAYEFDELVIENNLTTDQSLTGKIDLSYPYVLASYRGELKSGIQYRRKMKDRENKVDIYGWEGDDDLTMDQVVGDFEDTDFMSGEYKMGLFQDPDKVIDFFKDNKSSFELDEDGSREDTDSGNYEATEDVIAGYAQTKFDIRHLRILGGLRVEQTMIDYTGNELMFNEEGDYESTKSISEDNSYLHILPMIHARCRPEPNTNIRLAWTNSIARPNYFDLVPYRIVNREDEEMEIGNPDLEATESMNTDLMLEHYLKSMGVISAGLFYKDISNYIYISEYDMEGGEYDGYEVTQPVNSAEARLLGVEMGLQSQFDFLPGFLSGFGAYANYTYTWSEAEVDGRDDKIRLPGQAKHTANLALSYEKYGFSGRVAMNLHGSYISEVGTEPEDDVYYHDHTQIDVSASYRLLRNLSIFGEFINLGDEPLRFYQAETSRPIQREFYSWWAHVGLKWEI